MSEVKRPEVRSVTMGTEESKTSQGVELLSLRSPGLIVGHAPSLPCSFALGSRWKGGYSGKSIMANTTASFPVRNSRCSWKDDMESNNFNIFFKVPSIIEECKVQKKIDPRSREIKEDDPRR